MTTQHQLPIYDTRYQAPTMTMGAAKGTLGLTEDEILALIEEQGALYAFDISSRSAGIPARRELRILTQSVIDYHTAGCSPCYHTMLPPSGAVEAVLDCVPHKKPFLTGPEIQRLIICVTTHVTNLIESGALHTIAASTWRRGPGGSPHIDRQSFAKFLEARIVC